MWTLLRFALPLALVAVLLLPSEAPACSCAGGEKLFPQEGTVPPNVIFHARWWSPHALLLVDEAGQRVALRREAIGDRLVRLHPSAPLESGKRYRLEMDTGPGGAKMPPLATYTVQGEPDAMPPRPPASAGFDYRHRLVSMWSSCQTEMEGYGVRAEGASDDRTNSTQLATLVVAANAPDQVLALLMPGDDFMGHDVCFYNLDVDKAQGTQVALRSVDLAGNLSAPGPAVQLDKSMPLVISMLVQTTLGRALIIVVVTALVGLILLVARRSSRELRTG
jgi:hypothetical protein